MARQEPYSAIQPSNYESKYAIPQYIAENEWGGEGRYLDMKRSEKMDELGRVEGQIDEAEG